MDRKLLTKKLGLDVTATDEEILAKIATLNSAAADAETKLTEKTGELETVKAEKDEMENSITTLTTDLNQSRERVTTLEGELNAEREAVANGLLDAAVLDGRITQAERAAWLPRLTGDKRDEEVNALSGLKPAMNTKPIDVTKSRVEIGDEKGRRETIANAVEAIMKEKGVGYDDAWLLAKKDPALKPVWEAMRTEG